MKRICNLNGQILMADGNKCFAIYCTVSDRFDERGGNQVWETADELARDFDFEIKNEKDPDYRAVLVGLKERCVGLAKGNGY